MREIRVPLRRAELWLRWCELARDLDLPVGDPSDLRLPGSDLTLHRPPAAEAALDRLVALARRRLPRYTVDPDALTLLGDPRATRSNATAALAELDALLVERRRNALVAELAAEAERGGLTAERIAVRYGVSRRTVFAWRAAVQKSPRDCTPGADRRVDDDIVPTGSPAVGTPTAA